MKNFWPHRSKAKGFPIQNLAFKARKKNVSLSPDKISDNFFAERNLKSLIEKSNYKAISNISIKKQHWANRDFSEYREAA